MGSKKKPYVTRLYVPDLVIYYISTILIKRRAYRAYVNWAMVSRFFANNVNPNMMHLEYRETRERERNKINTLLTAFIYEVNNNNYFKYIRISRLINENIRSNFVIPALYILPNADEKMDFYIPSCFSDANYNIRYNKINITNLELSTGLNIWNVIIEYLDFVKYYRSITTGLTDTRVMSVETMSNVTTTSTNAAYPREILYISYIHVYEIPHIWKFMDDFLERNMNIGPFNSVFDQNDIIEEYNIIIPYRFDLEERKNIVIKELDVGNRYAYFFETIDKISISIEDVLEDNNVLKDHLEILE